jgi:hypothetical protein
MLGIHRVKIFPKRILSLAEQCEMEYLECQPKIQKLQTQYRELASAQVSRAEVMRIMSLVVKDYAARDFAADFRGRISNIWQEAAFDEQSSFAIDPMLNQRADGALLADALYFLMPDLVLDALKKKVDELVPKAVTLTLGEKRKRLAELEAELASIQSKSDEALGTYRKLVENPMAVPGIDPIPPHDSRIAAGLIPDPYLPEVPTETLEVTQQPSSYLKGQDAARLPAK